MPRKVWTPERDQVLREGYPKFRIQELAKLLGLSFYGVRTRIRVLGLKGNRRRPRAWTPEHDATLREAYRDGLPAASKALPMFTRSAIKNRINQLKLTHPQRFWTAEEDAFLREHYSHDGMTATECALVLGRGILATMRRVGKLGLLSGKAWTDAEKEAVRAGYASRGATALAVELLGSADDINLKAIRALAFKLGVTTPIRHPREIYDRVRELHSQGHNDRQIAALMRDYFTGRNARESVTAIRRRMKLPAIKPTHEQRIEMGRAGRMKQIATGVNPRDGAWAKLATSYGLPKDTPPRAVQILLALVSGPKTRPELRAMLGFEPSLHWNGPNTTYLSELKRRGMIATTSLPGQRETGRASCVYMLTPQAIDQLANNTKQEPTK